MRRAQRLKNKNRVKNKTSGIMLKILLFVVVILSVFLYIKLNTKYWDGKNKVAYVYIKDSKDVAVRILDPILGESTTFLIPKETQVEVARNYGIMNIQNVWQLGINEKIDGALLAQTVSKNFLFPVKLWMGEERMGLWGFVFKPGKTNIPLGDRIRIYFFTLKAKGIDTVEIDLAKSQFLKQQKLTDGSMGYVLFEPSLERLTIYFSDNEFTRNNPKFGINDSSGISGVSTKLGALLEVMGGKVVLLEKNQPEGDLICEVYGTDAKTVKKLALFFGCPVVKRETGLNAEIKIGAKFAGNF